MVARILPLGQMMRRMNKISIPNTKSTMEWFPWIIAQRTFHIANAPMASIVDFICDMKILWRSIIRRIVIRIASHHTLFIINIISTFSPCSSLFLILRYWWLLRTWESLWRINMILSKIECIVFHSAVGLIGIWYEGGRGWWRHLASKIRVKNNNNCLKRFVLIF